MLEVILKKDIYRLGDRGEVVRVASGYARNYLYPQRLAIPADKGSLKQLQAMRAAADREAVRVRGDAEKQLSALEGVVVRVVARASLNNQLYGSVNARDIAAKLAETGIEVDRHRIQMTTPIRSLGDYDIPVHIYKELASTIKVEVRAEGREDEPLTRSLESAAQLEFAPAPVRSEESEDQAEATAEASELTEAAAESDSPAEVAAETAETAEGPEPAEAGAEIPAREGETSAE